MVGGGWLYRRYLAIALDGLRARDGVGELPVPPLSTEQTHALLQPERSGQRGGTRTGDIRD